MLLSGKITNRNITVKLVTNFLSVILIFLIVFILNLMTGSEGFSFLPGLRLAYDRLFSDAPFLPQKTIEFELGLRAIDLGIAVLLFFQVRELIKSIISPKSPHFGSQIRDFVLVLGGIFAINYILFKAATTLAS